MQFTSISGHGAKVQERVWGKMKRLSSQARVQNRSAGLSALVTWGSVFDRSEIQVSIFKMGT